MKPADFIAKIVPAAIEDMRRTGIPASLTIAQAALESAWGASGLTQRANNLFGIKGVGPAGFSEMLTTEYYGGKKHQVVAKFRAYHNWAESIADHSKLVLNGTKDKPKRYHGVLGADYRTACHEIWRGGYATDPAYPQKLIGLIETHQLWKYDQQGGEKVLDKVAVTVNGQKVADGFIIDGLTMVPARAVAEALGATVNWDGQQKKVDIVKK